MTGHGGRDTGRALHGARRGVLQKLLIYYVKTTSESCRRRRWPLGPLACLDTLTNTLLVKPIHFGCRIVAAVLERSWSAARCPREAAQRHLESTLFHTCIRVPRKAFAICDTIGNAKAKNAAEKERESKERCGKGTRKQRTLRMRTKRRFANTKRMLKA